MHILAQIWNTIQRSLFPNLEEEIGPLTDKQQDLVAVLELVRIEEFAPTPWAWTGRPPHRRAPLARAFVAKAIYDLPTTRALIDLLQATPALRRICGWENRSDLPDEATFSRAFAEFAASELPQRVHAALIEKYQKPRLVGHVSRDSLAIAGRERAAPKPQAQERPAPKKRGRPKQGEARPAPEPTRLQRQASGTMTLEQMVRELPTACDWGCKKNSQGKVEVWKGYKFHLDWADGMLPVSALLTSASVHDSQVAIPLALTTAGRVTNLYDLMDAAYDAPPIRAVSHALGHVPLIDRNFRSDAAAREEAAAERARLGLVGHALPEQARYNERTNAERGNGRLRDEFGADTVRVRGPVKVAAHLWFGLLALAADALLRLVR